MDELAPVSLRDERAGPLAVSAFLTLADMYFRDYRPCFERRPPPGDPPRAA